MHPDLALRLIQLESAKLRRERELERLARPSRPGSPSVLGPFLAGLLRRRAIHAST